MPGQAERRTRLKLLASELTKAPEVVAYFAIPPRRAGSGPGWYMGPDYGHLSYLGYSAAAAEVKLLQLLEAEGAPA